MHTFTLFSTFWLFCFMKQKLTSSPFLAARAIHYLLQTAALRPCTMSPAIVYVFLWFKAKTFSESTTMSLDLSSASTFDACTTTRCIHCLWDAQGWSQEVCTVFIVCSVLHITHGMQLLWTLPGYMSYICIALTIGVLWFPTQTHWSHLRLPVWCSELIINVQRVNMCGCLFIWRMRFLCKDQPTLNMFHGSTVTTNTTQSLEPGQKKSPKSTHNSLPL